jgi:hypothetical protein
MRTLTCSYHQPQATDLKSDKGCVPISPSVEMHPDTLFLPFASPSPSSLAITSTMSDPRTKHSIAAKTQALTLLHLGFPHSIIREQTSLPRGTVLATLPEASKRGYDPFVTTVLKDEYFSDSLRPGRPRKVAPG